LSHQIQMPLRLKKTAKSATRKAPDEKGTAAEKTIEDTTVEAQDVQAGASE